MAGGMRIEDGYLEHLVDLVASKFKNLKKKASIMSLGGSQWRFGKLVATKAAAPKFFYADNDQTALAQAEESGVLTSFCDPGAPESIVTVSKHEGIVLKNTFEYVAPTVSASLEDYFFALFKALKLNGTVVMVTRLKPTLPLPPAVVDAWTAAIPPLATLDNEATECGFMFEATTQSYSVEISKEAWKEELMLRRLPYMSEVTDADIEQCLANHKDMITCHDDVTVITLYKVIR